MSRGPTEGAKFLVDSSGVFYRIIRATKTMFIVENPITLTNIRVNRNGKILTTTSEPIDFGRYPKEVRA
jgi:hypothetical protein